MIHSVRFATLALALSWTWSSVLAQTTPTPPAPAAQPAQPPGSAPSDTPPDGADVTAPGDTAPPDNGDAAGAPADTADTPVDTADTPVDTADTPVDTADTPADTADAPADTDVIPSDELPADEAEQADEVIVMTGSRIRTDPLDAPAPVLQLDSEEIARTGMTSVADLLQHLPVSGGALNARFNSSGNFGFPPDGGGIGAGAAQADMRYLGSKRVLVLVDGVRWINGSSASGVPSATDLNTIPIGIIERIEVLEDGASPIYGSDAIAGVINIITKKNWDGAQAGAYLGGYHQGDGFTQQYDVTWGQKNERMSMVMSAYFVEQRRALSADRSISRFPVAGVSECTPNCSSGTPQGRFVFTDPNTGLDQDLTINDDVGRIPLYNPMDSTGSDFHDFTISDRFNYAPYNLMITPSRRFGFFSGVKFKLLDRVSLNARALYNHRDSVNQGAPEPLFVGPEAGNGNRLDRISIDVSNPYNPFGFTLDAATNPYFIGRRPIEAGPRIFEQSVNTFYLSAGLEGDFKAGTRRFFWDTTAAFGINRADQLKHGAFNSAKLEKALGPLAVCEADAECVPFNIFGGQGADGQGTITREMLDYVTFVQKDVSQQDLIDLTANLSGELFKLPAGAVGFATGVEHRKQSGFFQPDAVVVAGDSAGVPSSPTKGEFTATEGYAEVRIPLAARRQFANLLDLSGAVRVSDYSTFGAQATLKGGARWRPSKDLLLRGNYAQGLRAPGIGELFGSKARFDQTLQDPCSDFLGNTSGNPAPIETQQNCIAQGVPADGSYEQFNQQISVTTGGNRALDAEASKSLTLSLVYSPTWLEERVRSIQTLNLELTYYRIELEGAIQAIDAQVQLDACVQTGDPGFCNGISRTPNGTINGFSNQLTNIGGITTDGLDLSLTYLSPKYPYGQFRVTSLSNVLLHFTESIPNSTGFEDLPREGTEVGDPERAFPRFKSNLVLDWFHNDIRASLTSRYIHGVTESCRGFLNTLGLCSDPDMVDESLGMNKIAPILYNDVQLTWSPRKFDNLLDLSVGVNNLFNRDPPKCYSCALNGFDATTHDIPGVFGYVKAGYRMW
jgi:iron complex outermembrane receptor protein